MEAISELCSGQDSKGVMTALGAYGAADVYFKSDSNIFNGKKLLLQNEIYKTIYCNLTYFIKKIGTNITYSIVRDCDLINMMDLIIENPEKKKISELVEKIEVEFGGQRIDCFSCTDIETQIRTTGKIYKREVFESDTKIIIPLSLAPLHNNNLTFPSSLYHELRIWIKYRSEDIVDRAKLYAQKYYLDTPGRKFLSEKSLEYVTFQNQYTGAEVMKKGKNIFKINYNHPIYLIYFWGFDKSKVKNVKLCLNKNPYFDDSLDILEYNKKKRGLNIDPCVIFFSEDMPGEFTKSSVNFSRIDHATIEIETDQEEDCIFEMVGISMQPIRYMSGMVGLAFSK